MPERLRGGARFRLAAAALAVLAASLVTAACGRTDGGWSPGRPPGEDAGPAGAGASPLTIYYSASLNGNLDGCTCEHNPTAGLVKRAAFLRALPGGADAAGGADAGGPTRSQTAGQAAAGRVDGGAAGGETALLVDAGDLLSPYPDPALAGYILASYRELGYRAVALGEQEVSLGAQTLWTLAAEYPLLCHNLSLRLAGGWTRFSPRPLLLDLAGRRVAVFALLEPGLLKHAPPAVRRQARLAAPGAAARELLRLPGAAEADLRLLLYHGTEAGLRRLLGNHPPFDLVLLGHEQKLLDAQRVGRSLVVSPGEQGNRLGILELGGGSGSPGDRLGPARNRFRLFSYRSDPDDPLVRRRADAYREMLRERLKRGLNAPQD